MKGLARSAFDVLALAKRLYSEIYDAIMGIVMVAMLAFGGTFAYFTATTSAKSATLTTGKVSLKSGTSIAFSKNTGDTIVPGDSLIEGDVAYVSESTVDTYVAIVFSYTAAEGVTEGQLAALKEAIKVTTENTWEECGTTKGVFIYKGTNYKLAGAESAQTLDFVKGGIEFSKDYKENFDEGTSEKGANSIENIEFTISFKAYAVQADNIVDTDPATAEEAWTAMKTVLGDLVA